MNCETQTCVSTLRRTLALVAMIFASSLAFAQQRCGTSLDEQKILQANPKYRTEFEQWMQQKIIQRRTTNQSRDKTNSTYKIPVVVHIIHNGETVGTGTNIPDAQVLSQIRVMNEDYQRANADASLTPAEFLPFASSVSLEFVLAKQDPDGLPTTGIMRVKGPKSGYTNTNDNTLIKGLSYWPAEDYLNIWVVNLTDGYLGYAQFPTTSLQGTIPPYDRTTDGVVIHYRAFGSTADGAFNLISQYNKGRTTTHEVGHFLGLLHTFGTDSGCGGSTDYVDDTPTQGTHTQTCPSSPVTQCGHHIMFQNYLDYTDDACMNLFTAGQIDRVLTVLQNSPRRISLLSSHGLNDPVILTLDAEARSISSPLATTCGQSIVPKVVVRNRGNTAVSSVQVSLTVNGVLKETKGFNINLQQYESSTLSFTTLALPEPSSSTIQFKILAVNGGIDNDPSNDTQTMTTQVASSLAAPYLEPFNSQPTNWTIVNPDNGTTWSNVTAPKSSGSNKAMFMDFYNYQSSGATDQMISPFLSIPASNAVLRFDRAYAMFPGVTTESLRILVLPGCSTDPSQAIEVYKKTGSTLATASSQTTAFVPASESQWASDAVSLDAYSGQTVRVIFEATNANGNNLYIDNVQLSAGELFDMSVVAMLSPAPVFCNPSTAPAVRFQNLGSTNVTRLNVTTEVNGTTSASQSFTNLTLSPGGTIDLTLAALRLTQSNNTIKVSVANPDALNDETPANNSLSLNRIFDNSSDDIPLRQNFDQGVSGWTPFATATPTWSTVSTSTYQQGLAMKSFSATTAGTEAWYVSPVLDLSRASQGSLFFSTSYAKRSTGSERLRVMVSSDCGVSYDQVIFDSSGDALANQSNDSEWTPSAPADWTKQYLSINDFAGQKNLRFAFVGTNANGNNLYLDNIEFYITDDPTPPLATQAISVYNSVTNPYEFFITFNIDKKQDARLVVFNALGQVVIDNQLPETLNQTYTVNLYGQSSGVYIARLETGSQTATAKLFVGR